MEIISLDEKYARIADNIVMRTYEVDAYNNNIEYYSDMLLTLPTEWSEKLLPLRNLDPHDAASQCDLSDLDLLSQLQQFDRLSYLIRTETLERNKAQKMLEIILTKLPDNIKEEEINKAIIRRSQI